MAVNANEEDKRIRAQWNGPVTVKFYGELYSAAKYALLGAGKKYLVNQMQEGISKVKNQREGIRVMQTYVRFQ
jgi:hypothetical protein